MHYISYFSVYYHNLFILMLKSGDGQRVLAFLSIRRFVMIRIKLIFVGD